MTSRELVGRGMLYKGLVGRCMFYKDLDVRDPLESSWVGACFTKTSASVTC